MKRPGLSHSHGWTQSQRSVPGCSSSGRLCFPTQEGLCRHWLHSEMWWPCLFEGQAHIAWDDYEKDYSDLPREVLAPHAALEGAKEVTRRLEASEASYRACFGGVCPLHPPKAARDPKTAGKFVQ